MLTDAQIIGEMKKLFKGFKTGISTRQAFEVVIKETRRLRRLETKYKSKQQRCKGCE